MKAAAVIVAAVAVALAPRGAVAADDEPTNLRVSKAAAGSVQLSWTPPVLPADSYQVRRCVIASVDETAGECIVQGLAAPSFVDTPPAGGFFYLVSGRYGLREGSLGEADDGTTTTPRTAPACGGQPDPGAMTLEITLPTPVEICGSDIRVRFDLGGATFVSAACTGIQSAFSRVGQGTIPGPRAFLVCGSTSGGATGPGPMATFTFDVGSCPLDVGDFVITSCEVTDCVTFAVTSQPCTLAAQ